MARKKIEPIISLGNEDKLIVQKSLPLFSLWRSELTLAEFKILDTYLSRINSHDTDKRVVMFEKGELENILGVKKINQKDLEDRLKHLMGNVVEIADEDIKKGFKLITLFEEAIAEQDKNGLWQIKLECTQKAMKYFFNIENLGYLRYKLRCITSLTSRYTYIMFIYLEANRYRKSWDISVDELKQILDCDKEETYKAFKRFNDLLLKKVQKEMNEKTECRYKYEPIRKGRNVVAIHFEIETLSNTNLEEIDENQMTFEQWQEEAVKEKELWQEPLEAFEFNQEQYDEIFSVLITIPSDKLPQSQACHGSVELMRYHYLDQKAKEILRRDKQKPIRSKFAYLLKLMKQDAE
ncbi:initiator RepB protein [Lachnoanaerobaculum sp. MSX33]|jgi:initiator repB protein|uniref:replication initiation protein n=1 Tax=Lachnoanaerobaculum sp. MSX33 TaxID=936596 RepID=UPI0003DF89B9|nr:replication initiation protein [Lachnoanaerobaculum sp. MSX33]ETO97628.1 initiator RepB protein [Lachnoanaerobaculum sp. MSX33]